ncbi:unnamed protein product [Urochloa humidicola]
MSPLVSPLTWRPMIRSSPVGGPSILLGHLFCRKVKWRRQLAPSNALARLGVRRPDGTRASAAAEVEAALSSRGWIPARTWRGVLPLWPTVKAVFTSTLLGQTFADWSASVVTVDGGSMYPTLDDRHGEPALLEKRCLYRYDLTRGDVVVFKNHRELVVKRLIALPGDWIQG